MEDYDVTTYPEGYERVRDEELAHISDDPNVRAAFMTSLLLFLSGG